MIIPTCDNVQSQTMKALVHGGTVLLHVLIVAYHLRNAVYHWRQRQ